MCGMGRTGTLHACEQEGIAPDLMTIAKGLGGGYQPIGAVLLQRARSSRPSRRARGFFQHGHTYMGHPLACAAALAVQQVIRRDDLLGQRADAWARMLTRRLRRALRQPSARRRHPRPRPVPGDRAGRGPRRARRRSIRRASCTRAIKKRGDGARPDGLSDGRHDRRRAAATTCCWRRRSSSRRRHRHDRRAARRRGRCGIASLN